MKSMIEKSKVVKGIQVCNGLSENEKLSKYMRILRVRRTAKVLFLVPPLFVFLLDTLKWGDAGLIAFGICWMLLVGGAWFSLIIVDICPWCRLRFFVKGTDVATVFDYWSRKQCANCGQPDDKGVNESG